jgi:hypothetical protein
MRRKHRLDILQIYQFSLKAHIQLLIPIELKNSGLAEKRQEILPQFIENKEYAVFPMKGKQT